jgi:hypothetical protein
MMVPCDEKKRYKNKGKKKKKRKKGNLHHSHSSFHKNIITDNDDGFNMTSTTTKNKIDNSL